MAAARCTRSSEGDGMAQDVWLVRFRKFVEAKYIDALLMYSSTDRI